MDGPARTTRVYKSSLRAARAAETRQLIVSAAGEVFAERGYVGATMAQIATRASVSVESVHGVGPKSDLLILAFKQIYAGASGWKTILDEPDLVRIMATENTDEALRGYAAFIASANARSRGIWAAVRTAALAEPKVATEVAKLISLKKQDFLTGVGWYVGRGLVEPDADVAGVASYLYLLTSQETYEQLVGDWAYSSQEYEEWLTAALHGLGARSAGLPGPGSR